MSEANNNIDQKQKWIKYAVFAGMFLAFAISMWLIFAPSQADKDKEQQAMGFNSEIPDPKKGEIISDKRDAYQKEQSDNKQKERMRSLEAFMLETGLKEDIEEIETTPSQQAEKPAQTRNSGRIQQSSAAYQDINRTLGSFYDSPKDDPEKKELRKKLEELEARLEEKENKQNSIDEQIFLMEKSYQLAAKYMPQAETAGNVQYPNEMDISENQKEGLSAEEMKNKIVRSKNGNEKSKITSVRQIQDRTVSALKQSYSNEDLIQLYDQPRNFGFNTVKNEGYRADKNTIKACVHGDQSVMSGQSVFVRLLEAIVVDDVTIPVNTILTANASLQGERLNLLISTIEYEGAIYPVKMSIYDTDGTKGVYVPASMEIDALKEVAANMGNTMGQSFTMTQSAGAQITSDLTKGTIQGVSQLFAKKLRMVKINLKAGHKVLLFPEKQ